MNFDWVKAPKSKEEEKEQFDKLYHMLVQLSKPEPTPIEPVEPATDTTPTPLDEFTQLKMDLLANFQGIKGQGQGVEIPALETCKGCQQSFYSQAEHQKHLLHALACSEWYNRGKTELPIQNVPFFSFLDKGLSQFTHTKECSFCHKSIPYPQRKGLERHYTQSPVCNRLAHDTFRSWFESSYPGSHPNPNPNPV